MADNVTTMAHNITPAALDPNDSEDAHKVTDHEQTPIAIVPRSASEGTSSPTQEETTIGNGSEEQQSPIEKTDIDVRESIKDSMEVFSKSVEASSIGVITSVDSMPDNVAPVEVVPSVSSPLQPETQGDSDTSQVVSSEGEGLVKEVQSEHSPGVHEPSLPVQGTVEIAPIEESCLPDAANTPKELERNSNVQADSLNGEAASDSCKQSTSLHVASVTEADQTKLQNAEGGSEETPHTDQSPESSKKTGPKSVDEKTVDLELAEGQNMEPKEGVQTAQVNDAHSLNSDQTENQSFAIKEGSTAPRPTPKMPQKCIVCKKVGKCKYNIVRNGDIKHLCEDSCFQTFRQNPTKYLRQEKADITEKTVAPPASTAQGPSSAHICNYCQTTFTPAKNTTLNLKCDGDTKIFCQKSCMDDFQKRLKMSNNCNYCNTALAPNKQSMFGLKVDGEMKPFCQQSCMEEYQKRLKLCANCNREVRGNINSFMAPIVERGNTTFRDFCSPACHTSFNKKTPTDKSSNDNDVEIVGTTVEPRRRARGADMHVNCAVCGKMGEVRHEVNFDGKNHKLCSEACFAAFRYTNKLAMNHCSQCGAFCVNEGSNPHSIQFEGQLKRFCSVKCVTTFKVGKTKVQPCAWCGTKKHNFDMIERVDANNKYQLFCSLSCLSLYRVNLQATSNQSVTCDQCKKVAPAQYHLTMSDASVRNFCMYSCVMAFQAQFNTPASGKAPNRPPTRQGATKATTGKIRQIVPQQNISRQVMCHCTSESPTQRGMTTSGSLSSEPVHFKEDDWQQLCRTTHRSKSAGEPARSDQHTLFQDRPNSDRLCKRQSEPLGETTVPRDSTNTGQSKADKTAKPQKELTEQRDCNAPCISEAVTMNCSQNETVSPELINLPVSPKQGDTAAQTRGLQQSLPIIPDGRQIYGNVGSHLLILDHAPEATETTTQKPKELMTKSTTQALLELESERIIETTSNFTTEDSSAPDLEPADATSDSPVKEAAEEFPARTTSALNSDNTEMKIVSTNESKKTKPAIQPQGEDRVDFCSESVTESIVEVIAPLKQKTEIKSETCRDIEGGAREDDSVKLSLESQEEALPACMEESGPVSKEGLLKEPLIVPSVTGTIEELSANLSEHIAATKALSEEASELFQNIPDSETVEVKLKGEIQSKPSDLPKESVSKSHSEKMVEFSLGDRPEPLPHLDDYTPVDLELVNKSIITEPPNSSQQHLPCSHQTVCEPKAVSGGEVETKTELEADVESHPATEAEQKSTVSAGQGESLVRLQNTWKSITPADNVDKIAGSGSPSGPLPRGTNSTTQPAAGYLGGLHKYPVTPRRGRPAGRRKRGRPAGRTMSSVDTGRGRLAISDTVLAHSQTDPDFLPSLSQRPKQGRGRPRKKVAIQESYDETDASIRKSGRVRKPTYKVTNQGTTSLSTSFPVISNVVSLAPNTTAGKGRGAGTGNTTTSKVGGTVSIGSQIIIQPPPPKSVKNKSLLCKPFVQTKATMCRPHTVTQGTQTDESVGTKQVLVPVPVPIYVPVPMAMYNIPQPYPLPIPVPIPVPCFIPTTKKSADSILKQIKEIQERMPADPFEAELLMMAEAVANAEKSDSSGSDTEIDEPKPAVSESSYNTSLTEQPSEYGTSTTNERGEDMLQIALRMAEMPPGEDATLDLEDTLAPSTGQGHAASSGSGDYAQGNAFQTNYQSYIKEPNMGSSDFSTIDQDNDILTTTRDTRSGWRGKRRRGRGSGGRNKRTRIEEPPPHPDQVAALPTGPAPDANMVLKYTYGVNAWKHWVVCKNEQLERASSGRSGKLKLFKTEIMQCSADELNYSLCLFVKEVRKPNGDEYAPDSIYYLCLGIQQYLFENGRIDNIFTDFYYEKFTECLNEVLHRYEVRLNTQGLIVCRIEEEHLWESKQLGAHSPHVLLNTLIYFNTKYFLLHTPEDHLRLSFSHIMKHWKKTNTPGTKTPGRSVYLRYYAPVSSKESSSKRRREEIPVYEQGENAENPLRCPVKLYEFYLSKCPESIKNRNDVFYLVPERSCVPDSPVWYSTASLGVEAMTKMLNRVRVVREIQEAHLHHQPPFS